MSKSVYQLGVMLGLVMFLAPTLLGLNMTREQFKINYSDDIQFVENYKGYEIWYDPQRVEPQDVGGWVVYAPVGQVPNIATIRYSKAECRSHINSELAEYLADSNIGIIPDTPTGNSYVISWRTSTDGVSGFVGNYTYVEGAQVLLKAVPDEGYVIDHWEKDGATLSSNTYAVMATKDMVVTVFFKPAPVDTTIPPDEDPSDVIEAQIDAQPIEALIQGLVESNPVWATVKAGGLGLTLISGVLWVRDRRED